MKQRLVGAIVLVALAVIFLPMLLDGSGQSGPRDVAIDIPDQPQAPANRLTQPEAAATGNDDTAASADASPATGAGSQPGTMPGGVVAGDDAAASDAPAEPSPADNETSARATDGGSAEAGSGDGPATDEASSETARAETDAAADSASASEPAPEGEASTAGAGDSGPTSWVVQVGSFGRETNALVLRDRLRELDFDAFVERADTADGTVWRVRVGPVASEDAAERLSERVTDERGGPALVMTHP